MDVNRPFLWRRGFMDFELSKEQKLALKLFQEFTEREVKPGAMDRDLTGDFPVEILKKMSKLNMMGIPFRKKYSGAGGDYLTYILLVEELAKVCGSTSVILSAHTSLCCAPIHDFGNEDQKAKYLPALLKGEKLGAFALTEPDAGTDAAGVRTTAVLDGDNYILNGSKIFITNGGHADVFIVFAMTDRSLGVRGISAFIVERGFEGFYVDKEEEKMGIRSSSTTGLTFENCIVPRENLLGKEGQGFKIAMVTLDGGRIGIAAQALGIAEGALDEAIKYAKSRKQFKKSISEQQGIQWYLAEMALKVETAKCLVYKAAWHKETGRSYSMEAAMAKLHASEVCNDVTRKAVQIFGGYGFMKEYPVERMMRDAKITEIYEGTSEVQKMVIAANILK